MPSRDKDLPEWFWPIHSEAATIAGLLGNSVAILRSIDFNSRDRLYECFFHLSIGIERLLKLILIFDQYERLATFPDDKDLKKLGHSISELLKKAVEIQKVRNIQSPLETVIQSDPHKDMLKIIHDFSNDQRYFNLNSLTNNFSSGKSPIQRWDDKIFGWVRKKHIKSISRMKSRLKPIALTEVNASIFTRDFSGKPIRTWKGSVYTAAETRALQRHTPIYVVQVVRELVKVLVSIDNHSYLLKEFFLLFLADDNLLMRRKSWDFRRL